MNELVIAAALFAALVCVALVSNAWGVETAIAAAGVVIVLFAGACAWAGQ